MMLGLVVFVAVLVSRWSKLGGPRVLLIIFALISAAFMPLFYGSVGSFFQWPYADVVYGASWISFVLGPVVLAVISVVTGEA